MSAANRASVLRRNLAAFGIATAVALGVVFTFLTESLHRVELLSIIEEKLVDVRFRIRRERPPDERVVIVAIDSKSVEAIGRWPWSRATLADLMDRLREAGASTVAFDVLLTEPQGAREAAILREVSAALPVGSDADGARRAIDVALAEVLADQRLAKSFEQTFAADKALPVLAYDFVFEDDLDERRALGTVIAPSDEQIVLDAGAYQPRDENIAYLRDHPPSLAIGIRPVVPEVAAWCAAVGFANPIFDRDGSLRRERLFVVYSTAARIAFEAHRSPAAALQEPSARVQAFMPLAVAAVATHLRLRVEQLVLDTKGSTLSFPMPDGTGRSLSFSANDGTLRIDFHGAQSTFPTYSFVDVLQDGLRDRSGQPLSVANAFAGKLVFVGATDPGLSDFFPTPFTARLAGVEKHANVAANLLQGRSVRTHSDYDLVTGLVALATALCVALLVGNLGPLPAALALAAVAASGYAFSYRDFKTSGLVWNWTVPTLALVLGYAAVTAYRQLTEERSKRHIRSVFSTYMSPAAVSEILENPERLKLGGERRECTIFFSDLVGFTTLSEAMADPKDLVVLMNRYLGRMTELILAEDGILDKYIGDAIMAIFGAPILRHDHAARGCHAALRNIEALEKLRVEFRAEGLPDIDCRIGLNTGVVILGNMGSEMRMDYTALGDTVNLASRLEGANKPYHTRIMVGERTRQEALRDDPELVFRPLDLLAVKGKVEPVEVFELVGFAPQLTDDKRSALKTYETALAAYHARRFDQALHTFEAVLAIDPHDGPAMTYIERCQAFLKDPPPPDWDGVYRMTTK